MDLPPCVWTTLALTWAGAKGLLVPRGLPAVTHLLERGLLPELRDLPVEVHPQVLKGRLVVQPILAHRVISGHLVVLGHRVLLGHRIVLGHPVMLGRLLVREHRVGYRLPEVVLLRPGCPKNLQPPSHTHDIGDLIND